MLKSIPRVVVVLFVLMFLFTGFLVVFLYLKTGNTDIIFNPNQILDLKRSSGYLLPDETKGYTPIGYTLISDDGKSALLIGKIIEINKNGNEIIGKVALSEDGRTIVNVIFASDITKDTLHLQERRTNDLFPNSADYTTSVLEGDQIETKLREQISKLQMLVIDSDDSSCNQRFINNIQSGTDVDTGCDLKVKQVNIRIK